MRYSLDGHNLVWTLRKSDQDFILAKQKRFWLDYAVRILSYRHFGKFVEASQLHTNVIDHVLQQLDIENNLQYEQQLSSKSERLRKREIFEHLGIRKIEPGDRKKLKGAIFKTLSAEVDFDEFEAAILKWCVEEGIRPPTLTWIGRTYSARQTKIDKVHFEGISDRLSKYARKQLLASIRGRSSVVSLLDMRAHPGTISKANFDMAVTRLSFVRDLRFPANVIANTDAAWRHRVCRRVKATRPSSFREFSKINQVGLYTTYLTEMQPHFIDGIIEAFCDAVNKFSGFAKRRVSKEIAKHGERVREREALLRDLLELALTDPDKPIGPAVLERISSAEARAMITSIDMAGGYHEAILAEYKRSWFGHYRPMLRKMLGVISLRAIPSKKALMSAIDWIADDYKTERPAFLKRKRSKLPYLTTKQTSLIYADGQFDVEAFEVYTVIALQDALERRKIWVDESRKYSNPSDDIPSDFSERRAHYYEQIKQPRNPKGFTGRLKRDHERELRLLNSSISVGGDVSLLPEKKWHVKRYKALTEPKALVGLKQDFFSNYYGLPFIDVFKEAALDTGFLREFKPLLTKTILPQKTINKHLTFCLYGLGTNVGLAAMAAATDQVSESQLRHIKDAFIDFENIESANRILVESILRVRDPYIWGEPGIACASDSKQYAAWDHNPVAQKHMRYGSSGIMVYWHVERRSLCIFSRVKRVSTPEIAPMLHGILHHGIEDLDIEKIFTDSHGQTEVGFAFCHLLGFDLAPRIKRIAHQTLYLPSDTILKELGNIAAMCRRSIKWDLIEANYDELIQYATALREGGNPEMLMRLFRRENSSSPQYKAAAELGRVIKTIYVCRYLRSEALRREVQEGLNVMENWNGATKFAYFGRGGAFTSNKMTEMQLSAQALQLLQNSLVYVNTRIFQSLLDKPEWQGKIEQSELSRLSPLVWDYVNIMGRVELNMEQRLAI